MPPAAVDVPTHIDRRDLPVPDGSALPYASSRPDKSDDGRPDLRQRPPGIIEKAVRQIRIADDRTTNSRSQPRVAFVRPARISFSRPASEFRREGFGGECLDSAASFEVVMTDLSLEGAGILSYSCDVPLPPYVTLMIDGTAFDCEVRWSTRIGGRVYRYGLLFRAVRDNPPHAG